MNKQNISTLAIIFCAILGMIGAYWLNYYVEESTKIAPTYSPLEEPIKSWPVEEGTNPKG